jgi:glycine/D-amino acid oxidase-like deaminating enzyme
VTKFISRSFSRRQLIRGTGLLAGALAMPAILRPPSADAAAAAVLPSPDFSLPRTYLAGARPHRTGGFRLEVEELTSPAGKKYIVHNYGHSGAGITLSWGCADAVAGHVKTILDTMQAAEVSVAVIGCGVIGLTAATELLERWPALKLTVYAKDFKLEDTTSYKAGGQFEPSIIYNEYLGSPARLKVLHDTLRASRRKIIALTPKWSSYGITTRRNFTLREGTDGFDRGTPRDVVAAPKIANLPFAKLNEVGREYDTWLLDPTIMLPKLIADLKARGVAFIERDFRQKSDLGGLSEAIVINCAGFGGAAISGDRAAMTPLRGQLVVLPNRQKIDYFFSGGCGSGVAYLFGRTNDVVIGGTVERGRQPDGPGQCRPTRHDTALCDTFLARVRDVFDGKTAMCHR